MELPIVRAGEIAENIFCILVSEKQDKFFIIRNFNEVFHSD